MSRPSKKDIKAAIEKLKGNNSGATPPPAGQAAKPPEKKDSRRIRKQGV